MSIITITQDIDIDAPAEDAWAIVADYGRDPEWRIGVLAMVPSPPGPVGGGTTTVEDLRVAGRTYRTAGEVTTVDPGRRFEWRTTAGAVAHGSRSVEPLTNATCRVRLELQVTPTGVNRLLAPVLGRMLRGNLAKDGQRLRRLVEAERQAARSARRRGAAVGP